MIYRLKSVLTGVGLAAALFAAAPANAVSFIGLYDTGVDDTGKVLADGAADTHYKITASSDSSLTLPSSPFKTSGVTSWSPVNDAQGSAGSAWITPFINSDGTPGQTDFPDVLAYSYTLNFDLGDVQAVDAVLSGLVQSDNFVQIYLNNTLIGGQTPVPTPGDVVYFSEFTAFGTNGLFNQGLNTLRFDVTDYGVVTGLRVDNLIGTAVPEPGVWAMMIIGFGLVASQIRRRRRNGVLAIA